MFTSQKNVHVPQCSVTVTVRKGQLCRSCSGNGKNASFGRILAIIDKFPFYELVFRLLCLKTKDFSNHEVDVRTKLKKNLEMLVELNWFST